MGFLYIFDGSGLLCGGGAAQTPGAAADNLRVKILQGLLIIRQRRLKRAPQPKRTLKLSQKGSICVVTFKISNKRVHSLIGSGLYDHIHYDPLGITESSTHEAYIRQRRLKRAPQPKRTLKLSQKGSICVVTFKISNKRVHSLIGNRL